MINMNVVPIERSYTLSASVPMTEVPTSPGGIDMLLMRLIGTEIANMLTTDGYACADSAAIVPASQVTVDIDTEPGHAIFLARFPHPHGTLDDELHPVSGPGELIGGPWDGLDITAAGDAHDERGTGYERAAYSLADNLWMYRPVPQPAIDESESA